MRFPYNNEIIYQDFAPLRYDSGNYEPVLDQRAGGDRVQDVQGRAGRCAPARPASRYRNRLLCRGHRHWPIRRRQGSGCNRTARSVSPPELAPRVRDISPCSPRSAADQLGRRGRRCRCHHRADTDQFYWGGRHLCQPGACAGSWAWSEPEHRPSTKPRRWCGRSALKLASDLCECSEDDLVIDNGKVSIVGIPERVRQARRSREPGQARCAGAVEPGTEPGLESTQYFGPKMGATANGVHAMIVEMARAPSS